MKRQHKGILPVLLLCAAAAMTTSCIFVPEEEEKLTKDGMTLAWSDEFDSGSVPSPSNWTYEILPRGKYNNEKQAYVQNSANAYVSGGTLKIKAVKDSNGNWTSTRINTSGHHSWKYGIIEARIKLPGSNGTWPAFWMMPQNSVYDGWPASGEMDIMENAPTTKGKYFAFSTLHASGHYGSNGKSIGGKTLDSSWHTYAIKWTSDKITAYYDDVAQETYYNDGSGSVNWPYDQSFYVILNLAMGGDLGGEIDSSLSSAIYEIDYVRVYQ
ncbi:MAG TPA: glycoside hydrolase [Treponema sp.]|nr:glycoside hydrolase [Treponema sp.]